HGRPTRRAADRERGSYQRAAGRTGNAIPQMAGGLRAKMLRRSQILHLIGDRVERRMAVHLVARRLEERLRLLGIRSDDLTRARDPDAHPFLTARVDIADALGRHALIGSMQADDVLLVPVVAGAE